MPARCRTASSEQGRIFTAWSEHLAPRWAIDAIAGLCRNVPTTRVHMHHPDAPSRSGSTASPGSSSSAGPLSSAGRNCGLQNSLNNRGSHRGAELTTYERICAWLSVSCSDSKVNDMSSCIRYQVRDECCRSCRRDHLSHKRSAAARQRYTSHEVQPIRLLRDRTL